MFRKYRNLSRQPRQRPENIKAALLFLKETGNLQHQHMLDLLRSWFEQDYCHLSPPLLPTAPSCSQIHLFWLFGSIVFQLTSIHLEGLNASAQQPGWCRCHTRSPTQSAQRPPLLSMQQPKLRSESQTHTNFGSIFIHKEADEGSRVWQPPRGKLSFPACRTFTVAAQWIKQEGECFSFSLRRLCGRKFCQQSWQANQR